MITTTALPFDVNLLTQICRQNDVSMLGVFGSAARGELNADSDIDLLVRFSKKKSLFNLVDLEEKLIDALGKEIDIVTEASLSPHLRDSILGDLIVIYES